MSKKNYKCIVNGAVKRLPGLDISALQNAGVNVKIIKTKTNEQGKTA